MKVTKEKKGITLIALVITIVILLILAGITIQAMTNQSLFEKADEAKKKTENAQVEEEETLADYENTIGEYVSGTREQIMVDKEEYEELKNKVEELSKGNKIHIFKNVSLVCSNGKATWTHNLGIKNYIAYVLPVGGLIPSSQTLNGEENSCNLYMIWSNKLTGYSGTFKFNIVVIEMPE